MAEMSRMSVLSDIDFDGRECSTVSKVMTILEIMEHVR